MAPRLPSLVITGLALLCTGAAYGQFVPPVPKGLRGDTAVGTAPIPLPRSNQQWIRATSANFTIISSAPEARTREIAELLETVAGALRRVHPRFDARFTDTTVFLFNRRRDSQPFFEVLLNQKRTRAPGAFIVQPDGTAVIIVDSGRPLSTNRTVKHELMHNILAASGTRLPLWLEEGIAEYFSTTVIRGDTLVVGRPIVSHQLNLRARGTLPMEELITARRGSPTAGHILFYPQSWAMVDWMMRSGRQTFYKFVADVESGLPVEEAFRAHYSVGLGAVARSIRNMPVRPSAASMIHVERRAVPVSTTAIDAADVLYEIGSFLGRFNATRADAERYLLAALDAAPHHARATAGLGTLRAYDRKYEDALPFFEEAMAIDPDDPAVRTGFAEALLQNAIGPFAGVTDLGPEAAGRFRRARELAESVLARQQAPLAQAIAGTTYLIEEDPSPGVSLLEQAHAARPARLDFAFNLYALYLRLDRTSEAEALFENVFSRSPDPQTVLASRSVYVREHLLRANRLIKQQRIEEAAAVVRGLVEVTPDPAAQAELIAEADRLSRVAEANRQILAYNEAVHAFNRSDNDAALLMLEQLLAVVTDEIIREKAENLRIAVRKRLPGM